MIMPGPEENGVRSTGGQVDGKTRQERERERGG